MNNPSARVTGNLPELVWNELKLVAAQNVASNRPLTVEECVQHVEAVVRDVVGWVDALPPAVVLFYAEELAQRIALSLR